MPLLQVIIILIIIGVLLWLINTGPLAPYVVNWVKQLINALAVVGVVIWLLTLFWPASWGPWIGHR